MEEPPGLICACSCDEIIPFEYYTTRSDTEKEQYNLVLCALCRGCGGYREVQVKQRVFPYQIKEPPKVAGVKLRFKNQPKISQGVDYIL